MARDEMRAASRLRRRLLSAGFVAAAMLMLLIALEDLAPSMRWKALLCAPPCLLLGLVGLVYPWAVPDPRPPAGAIGAVAGAGTPALAFGGCVFFVGIAIGVWLLFVW